MTRTSPASTYDDDFFAWTQEQAAALRRLPEAADIDIAHVAEEIEDLGKRDLREVTSYLARLLEHLIKIDALPSSRDIRHWRAEALNFHISAMEAFTPSMRRALSIDQVLRVARRRIDAARETGLDLQMPSRPLVTLDDLLIDFDLDTALAKIATAREQTPRP